jgi:hypothetical protein
MAARAIVSGKFTKGMDNELDENPSRQGEEK